MQRLAVRTRRDDPRAPCRAAAQWLGAFYFLTFGGFVAFSIYLPTLLRAIWVGARRRRFRAAGFVVLATLMRPLGGWLSDRIGGAQVLSWVFGGGGVAAFSLLMIWPSMIPFTVGALGCAALLGLGNGAVFQLVASGSRATPVPITGLVGALGAADSFRRCCSDCSATPSACCSRASCCCH